MTEDALGLLPQRLGLPRGRSALPESEVAASQRGRLMQAVIDEVADVGYARATVAGITRRARVSRTTFYQSFSDKEDCFAQAYVLMSAQIHDLIIARAGAVDDAAWQDRIEAGVQALVDSLEAMPSYARSYMVEVHAAGDTLLRQRDVVMERHARSLQLVAKLARAAAVPVREPRELEAIGAIGATAELIARAVRRCGRDGQLSLQEIVAPVVTIQSAVIRGE